MQQQQKAQKLGNQRKSINSYTKKKIKLWLKWPSRPNQCVVTKKPTTEKNSAQTTQQFNASKE